MTLAPRRRHSTAMKALHLHGVGRSGKVHTRSQGMVESSQPRSGRQVDRAHGVAAEISRRLLAPAVVLCLGLGLGSCASSAGFIADHWPHWAGGLPADAPPRPGAPGYDEFIAHQSASKNAAAPAAADKTDSATAPAGYRPPDDQSVVQGGLY
jgi:hypothetical protein